MTREEIQKVVLKEFQSMAIDDSIDLSLDTTLESIGLDSMNIINVLLKFERILDVEFDGMFGMEPPETVGQICDLICKVAEEENLIA